MRSRGPPEEEDEKAMRLGSDAEWEIAGDKEQDQEMRRRGKGGKVCVHKCLSVCAVKSMCASV